MNISENLNLRIKELRKSLGISQKELAKKMGISQGAVSWNEQPGNNVTYSTIKSICTILNANESYLLDGTLPMFVQPDAFSLDEFIKEKGGTELEIDIVKAYFEIDLETRRMLVEHFKNSLAKQAVTSNSTLYSDIPDDPEEFERLFPPIEPEEEESNIG